MRGIKDWAWGTRTPTMLESESSALPFGESPMSFAVCRNDKMYYIITKNKMQALFSFFLKFFAIFLQSQYLCGFPIFIFCYFLKCHQNRKPFPVFLYNVRMLLRIFINVFSKSVFNQRLHLFQRHLIDCRTGRCQCNDILFIFLHNPERPYFTVKRLFFII